MTEPRRSRSIASTLTWMNVLASGIALLLVYFSFLAYNLYSLRQATIENYLDDAQIVGANSISAIIFDDKNAAESTLSALSHSSDIVAAAIYTDGDIPFAQYPANGSISVERRTLASGVNFDSWASGVDILIASRIELQGKPIGTVYLQAHLNGLRREALQYGAIAGAILLICLAVALIVGLIFRRILARPIVSFAETARMVTRYRDYSLRFTPQQNYDELASLTEAFNEMLAEIQERDQALEQAKTGLELRVEERTAELQTANRELEAFSYTVAHDLRAPLQSVNNICFLLQETGQEPPSEGQAQLLNQLRASVTVMSAMIDDLLDLSRSTSAPLQSVQTNLSIMAESILDGLATANPHRKISVTVQPRCLSNADPGLMRVVMQNLLRNAWKFTARSQDALIEFGCTKQDNRTVYFVRDNGAGFDQRQSDRLFKPFQRLHAASDYPGTGIGLATVKRIILRHGGEIWAEGKVQKGATFYFTLEPPAERTDLHQA